MAKLWHTKRIASLITATDAQPGYPASNLATEALGRPWRSVDLGAKTIDIILPLAAQVEALFLTDVNFSTCNVRYSNDGAAFSSAVAFPQYANDMARYRGLHTYAQNGLKTARIEIPAGASTDGLAYWRIGAAYLMATKVDILGSEWGYQPVWTMPQVEAQLANGQVATASAGIAFDLITLTWKPRTGEVLSLLFQKARQGTVIWTPDISTTPDEIWPVRFQESRLSRTRENLVQTAKTATLREVVL